MRSMSIVPRDKYSSLFKWALETLRYISKHDLSMLGETEQFEALTLSKYEAICAQDAEKRDISLTAHLVLHDYTEHELEELFAEEDTKEIATAFFVYRKNLPKVLDSKLTIALTTFLSVHQIDATEIDLLGKKETMKLLADRIIDKSQTMYSQLVKNFYSLLRKHGHDVIDKTFIRKYIECANFQREMTDDFLKYILESNVSKHPDFMKMHSLTWDPFTKSRMFTEWLKVIKRMEQLNLYYFTIHGVSASNISFITEYRKFKTVYGSRMSLMT